PALSRRGVPRGRAVPLSHPRRRRDHMRSDPPQPPPIRTAVATRVRGRARTCPRRFLRDPTPCRTPTSNLQTTVGGAGPAVPHRLGALVATRHGSVGRTF